MRIVVVSDTHLAPEAPAFDANWQAAADYATEVGAELTLHLGDVTADGWAKQAHVDHAAALVRGWPTPMRLLPGNHDIGDTPPGPATAVSDPMRLDRLAAFRAAFGPDRWVLEASGWRLIGLNTQLFGTAVAEEAEQWDWLESTATEGSRQPTILFMHKPLFEAVPAEEPPNVRYVSTAFRRRLMNIAGRTDLRLTVCGHAHQYRDFAMDGMRYFWMPAASCCLPDGIQKRVGEKIVGLAVLDLAPDSLKLNVVCPEGMHRYNILDFDLYPSAAKSRAELTDAQQRL